MTTLDGMMGKMCFHAIASSSLNHPNVSVGVARICAIISFGMAIALFLCQIAQPTVGRRGEGMERDAMIEIRGVHLVRELGIKFKVRVGTL